jgi:putative phosphoesterase
MKEKILVLADSHGSWPRLQSIINAESPFSVLIHCGDGVSDLFHVSIPDGVRVIRVMGNIDMGRGFDIERTVIEEIAGERIMVTHGDLFNVKSGLRALASEAAGKGATRVFFGHTHSKILSGKNPLLFNPGAVNSGHYGVVLVENDAWNFYHLSLELLGW